jgi:hypothetical protein
MEHPTVQTTAGLLAQISDAQGYTCDTVREQAIVLPDGSNAVQAVGPVTTYIEWIAKPGLDVLVIGPSASFTTDHATQAAAALVGGPSPAVSASTSR